MNEIGRSDTCPPGTLLWIGDRHAAEFQESFRYCESRVAQLALRCDVADAIRRRAAEVRCILITRQTRQPLDVAATTALTRQYPSASIVCLLGTLCEGDRSGCLDRAKLSTYYWHAWNQVLPDWLEPCVHDDEIHRRATKGGLARSVAVVAASASTADPLMELATSSGAAVAWCRRPDLFRARNFDAVWWDDSVAKPVTARRWRQRLDSTRSSTAPSRPAHGLRQQHAWIVQSPRVEHYRHAKSGGVDLVLSKPGKIECLFEMLVTSDSATRTDFATGRRATAA